MSWWTHLRDFAEFGPSQWHLKRKWFGGSKGGGGDEPKDGLGLQKDIYQHEIDSLQPFLDAGTAGLSRYQDLLTPGGENAFLNNFYNSDAYKTMAAQANRNLGAYGEASGTTGQSSYVNDLARVAPTLGLQAYQQQLGNYHDLVNVGLSGATGQIGAGQSYAQAAAGIYQANQAADAQKKAGLYSGLGQLAGTALALAMF